MPRPFARLLSFFTLLVTLAANLGPLALAATTQPVHACCVRNAGHCHESATSASDLLIVRNTDCCGHGCGRAITTNHWAHRQPQAAIFSTNSANEQLSRSNSASPNTCVFQSQSTRAPPHFSII
jgi:hypothetical protein